jgi:hypothetical protein
MSTFIFIIPQTIGGNMKIAIIGSRDFDDYDLLAKTLSDYSIDLVVSGGAKGADALAERYALLHNIETLIFKPEYKLYNRGAPLKRNLQIIDASDFVIAFWDGKSRGTKHAIDYASSQNKQVVNPLSINSL